MNKSDVRRLLDKLWAARLGVLSASGGVSYMPLFMSVEDRKKAAAIRAVEEQDHIDLISSSSDYDSDDMDDETLAKRSAKATRRKEIYNRIMKQRRHATFLPIDEFARNFFEDEAERRWDKESAQGKVPNVAFDDSKRQMLGLVEAYSFWWSSQLICRDLS